MHLRSPPIQREEADCRSKFPDMTYVTDQEAAAAKFSYDPESDTENTPDSVFCTHGSGFTVKWDKVTEYMHLESCLKKASEAEGANKRRSRISNEELEAIMLREFGPIKRPSYRMPEVKKAENMPGESGYIDIQKTTCIIIRRIQCHTCMAGATRSRRK